MPDDQYQAAPDAAPRITLPSPYDADLHLSLPAMGALNYLAKQRGDTVDEVGEQAILFYLRLALPGFDPREYEHEAAQLEREARDDLQH